jgi:hypothetical protein
VKIIFAFGLMYVSTHSLAQNNINPKNLISISAGSLAFGTGDFFGYGVNIEYARRLNTYKAFVKHFSVAGELSFDHGSEQPKVINPSPQEFTNASFYSTTNIVLTAKVIYHPLNKTFAKGLNVSGGLSVGYTDQSFETQASYVNVGALSLRSSLRGYISRVVVGYRVTAGYDYSITKHILVGMRIDFDNYSGDINTLLAGKIGYSF